MDGDRASPPKRGSYGEVHKKGDRAFKRMRFMLSDGTVDDANLHDAMFRALFAKHPRPNIMRYHQVTFNRARAEIVVEMDRGKYDMHNYIVKHKFAQRMAIAPSLLRQLVRALHALHVNDIVHGDLKPGNVIVMDADPANFKVCLADFGGSHQHVRNTCGRTSMCTYAVAAPELVTDGACSAASDAFALGATLHYLIFKDFLVDPWNTDDCDVPSDEDNSAYAHAHRTGKYKKEHASRRDRGTPNGVDPEVYAAMVSLLHPDPAERGTVAQLYKVFFPDEADEAALRISHAATTPPTAIFDDTARRAEVASIVNRCAFIGKPRAARYACYILQLYTTGGTTNKGAAACGKPPPAPREASRSPASVGRRPSSTKKERYACIALALALLDNDNVATKHLTRAAQSIAAAVGFDFYMDANAWALLEAQQKQV